MTFDDLVALRDKDAGAAAAALGVDPAAREAITGYGNLTDVDALKDPKTGVRLLLRGDRVVLVYVGPGKVPDGVDNDFMVKAAGSVGEPLASREGKMATLHVVPEAGMAWSEENGAVGYLELFQPTTLDDYLEEIYKEPGPFIR